jgi:Right handed beta helix region
MLKTCLASGAALAALLLAASPAQALVVRAWVSGHGSDVAGCGAPTNACRTLQYAHDSVVAAGGEIDILDPAGYGAVTITKSISIVNDGVGTAGVQSTAATAAAITIDAPNGKVYLRGLNIDGVQMAGGNGIEFKAGSSLIVVNCVVRHFENGGLLIDPTTGTVAISVSDSAFLDNGSFGIAYVPQSGNAVTTGVLNRVTASQNGIGGIDIATLSTSGSSRFTIANSDASNNGDYGIDVETNGNNETVEISASTMESNADYGLWVNNKAIAHVVRSTLDFNGIYGIRNTAVAPGGTFSGGDNRAVGNGTAPIGGTALTPDSAY